MFFWTIVAGWIFTKFSLYYVQTRIILKNAVLPSYGVSLYAEYVETGKYTLVQQMLAIIFLYDKERDLVINTGH